LSLSDFIDDYATQRAILLERLISEDSQYHEKRYSTAKPIEAIYQPASGTVTTQTGASVQVESRVLTTTPLKLGDKINGQVVKRIVPVIDFDGSTAAYEAFL